MQYPPSKLPRPPRLHTHVEQRVMLHIWFRGKLPWREKEKRTDDEMDEDGKPEE
jgi:hypothetical protein